MKKVLLASTALVLSAGVAAADVAVSGDGRMGIKDDFGDSTDLGFTSRLRIAFSASGETDAGLAFGGSVRADNSIGGANGTAGSVFVEGSFGKISMGDVSGAAEQAVGDVSGVGLTGLGDFNENLYLSNNTSLDATDFDPDVFAAVRPVGLYEYSFGDGSVYLSASNPAAVSDDDEEADVLAIGADYSFGNFSVGAGYENASFGGALSGASDVSHWIIGGTAAFGDATAKLTYGDCSDCGDGIDQTAFSLDYVFGATTLTGFYRTVGITGSSDVDGWGLGVAYDLGGGASLKGGYADVDSEDAFDFGISMSF